MQTALFENKPTIYMAGDHSGNASIVGYGVVFDQVVEHPYLGRLSLDRHAFDDSLNQDTVSAFNHDLTFLLGRTTAGTLFLSVDDVGVKYRIPLGGSNVNKVAEMVKRGDVDQSSVVAEFTSVDSLGQTDRTHVMKVGRFLEIGPVTFGQFPQTSVGVDEGHRLSSSSYAARCSRLRLVEKLARL